MDYFSRLLPGLRRSSKQAVLGELGFSSSTLRRYLSEIFDAGYGRPGSLLGDPTFEATFGWKASESTMAQLAGDLLTNELVAAMDSPPAEMAGGYRFASDQRPYAHQLAVWKLLSDSNPRSVVISSGTGSGKTECFMVPIVDRLVRLRADVGVPVGVRALFLYPLNALINSQRDRLRAWTAPFGRDIRFCLYNGNTPTELPQAERNAHPNEVLDRKTLWSSPPPMLVTNATMLEYMLVRTHDAPIIEASQGKLEWVVLDEAHTYVGSQAAEVALLIRRVLHAFGVLPENVRFVATSATIGDPDGEAGERLKTFLAQVSGVDADCVHLVTGERQIPTLPSNDKREVSFADITRLEAESEIAPARYEALCTSSTAVAIRSLFVGHKPIAKLSEVARLIATPGEAAETYQAKALHWLDLLSGTRDQQGTSFLPLRAHLFHQTLSGVWACADPDCTSKHEILREDSQWRFGQVWLEPRKHCECGSPVYELISCDSCKSVHLTAAVRGGKLLHPRAQQAIDEFELDVETDAEGELEEDALEEDATVLGASQSRILIVNRSLDKVEPVGVDKHTREIGESIDEKHTLRLLLHEEGDVGLTCPVCGEAEASYKRLFRSCRVGAPFMLGTILPQLLEYAPDGEKPVEHPYRGRRLLTFNDSRQGTARIAARLQHESERNRIRGLIYHLTIREGQQQADVETSSLAQEIVKLEEILAQMTDESTRAPLKNMVGAKRAQLQQVSQPKAIGFEELARSLTNQGADFSRILSQYQRYSPDTFGSASGAMHLAQMLLVREFGRRPKRQNNLESMGLVSVQYPILKNVAPAPREWIDSGLGGEEWHDFLKIALDFFIRAQGSVSFPYEWLNWLGVPFSKSWLVDRDDESAGLKQRRWLRARRSRRSTLVKLLAYVMRADLDSALSQDRIDAVLLSAWNALTGVGLLERQADGFMLDYQRMAFAPITRAWICPVTRRFLDTALRGVTPYLPLGATTETAECQQFRIPLYPNAFGGVVTEDLARLKEARAWIESNDAIAKAREEGLWTGLNDRVIELSPYFVTAEHSAQQDSTQLDRYEKAFKKGDINLLSCSTTMEMGIDIGGIAIVAMNNVPPHPANYLQRAGRAGRRKEGRSVSLTLCKANPHDQAVFANSRWAFDTALPAPTVSLNSSVIVQRHVNSLILAAFLSAAASGEDFTKLNCEWFFTGSPSPSERLQGFCLAFEPKGMQALSNGLHQLVRHSAYEGMPQVTIVERCEQALRAIFEEWNREWTALLLQEQETEGLGENGPAHRAVLHQKSRMGREYLLRELATRGFLPGYGFPSHITSFDNLTIGKFKYALKGGREDNRFRKRELPSRDRVTALREYAPGAEVVMDGLMYRSAGITLNWHIPASQQDVNETQEIKFAWRCNHCGASGSSHTLAGSQVCEYCGETISACNIQRFLEPAGFAVDFFVEPTNDVTTQHFVPVEQPWITARGEWVPLANSALGRFRTTTAGHIFYHSRGIHSNGYAICLACGRAAPMPISGEVPREFTKPHKKLRGGTAGEVDCPGSNQQWALQKGISLGHEAQTDVLEIQLKDEVGLWVKDPVAARTLGAALRDSLAELLGVQASELACDIKEARPQIGELCRSILIYDRSAAGYASSAASHIERLFRATRHKLHCRSNCDSSCPQCILDFDQRFFFDGIDRFSALQVLTDNWLNMLRLPTEVSFFGEASQPEYCGLTEAVLRENSQRDVRRVRLFFSGTNADLGPSPIRPLAYRIAGGGSPVEMIIDTGSLRDLQESDRYLLASLADHPHIAIASVDALPVSGHGFVVAEVVTSSGATRWGVSEGHALEANVSWARTPSALVVARALSPLEFDTVVRLNSADVRPSTSSSGDVEIQLTQELDGPLQDFGARLWNRLIEEHAAAATALRNEEETVTAVSYSDRYLWSPLSAALLVNVVEALRGVVGQYRWQINPVVIQVSNERDAHQAGALAMVWHDWQEDVQRNVALCEAFNHIGMDAEVQSNRKASLAHGRLLEVQFASGKSLIVRFDQGVSYWRVAPFKERSLARFSFHADGKTQGVDIAEMRLPVCGGDFPTQIFSKVRG